MTFYVLSMDTTQDYINTAWESQDLTQKSHYIIFDFNYAIELDGFELSVGDGGYITSFSVSPNDCIRLFVCFQF